MNPNACNSKPISHRLKYAQLIVLVFAFFILVGTFCLMLPVSSSNRTWTPFINALFTATSANCVTGLVVYDTYLHWSLFGKIVILLLIQIGGLGFMSVATIFSLVVRRRISLNERIMMQEEAGSLKLGGIIRITKHLLLGTLLFEGLGTIILAFRFCPKMGLSEGLFNACFHSISAFCNAGFDLMGKYQPFSSLTTFSNDPVICLTIASLIVIGGLGFMVWEDFYIHKWNYKKYTLQTKAVLLTTTILITIPTVLIFIAETDKSMAGMAFTEKLVTSLFQSITPRTAGFNAVDLTKISDSTVLLTTFLMFIGGSPGSTAGGMKTTTIFLLFAVAVSVFRGKSDVTVFKRRLEDSQLKKAFALAVIYLSVVVVSIALICMAQDLPLKTVIFEVFSAIGTVGSTLGITTSLTFFSKTIIILLMYFGRVGILSIVFTFLHPAVPAPLRYPVEKLNIG